MNKQNLNTKELEITNIITDFFSHELGNTIDVYVDFSKPVRIEFKNEIVRLNYRLKPEESDCEEQLRISTIFFDTSLRNKGLFKRLMIKLIEFCKKYNNMPILFTEVVSEPLTDILKSYGGEILHEDKSSGRYILVLPERWNLSFTNLNI